MTKNNTMEKTFKEKSQSKEWGAWKFVSDMLDNPDEYGIYPTSQCYEKIHDFVVEQKHLAEQSLVGRIRKEIENTPTAIAPSAWAESLNGYRQVILSLPSLSKTTPDGDNQ